MGRRVDVDELIKADEVAAILGLAQANNVATYLKRYPDMPRPVIDLGPGHPNLWVRSDVVKWQTRRARGSAKPTPSSRQSK